jgi:uroporphyrinogen decarboxylase
MSGKKQGTEMGKPMLDVLSGKTPEHMPIWLMRQAGRYLPEYRELRKQAGNFLDLCLTPKRASEITMQPIRRFGFDAAIIFADILLIPYALGQKLEFLEGEGPVLARLEDEKDLLKLRFDENKLMPVYETLKTVQSQLPAETALIGFCGGMWTVAAYMIDGTSRNDFVLAKSWAREKPEHLGQLIALLLDASEHYLCRQIEAGAEILQIFESWAGLHAGQAFERWVIEPTRELVSRVKKKYPHVPIIGFPREAGMHYPDYALKTGVDCVSIDQHVTLDKAREWQSIKPLQGNLDPLLLVKGGDDMRRAARAIMDKLGPGHIFNLGHGVVPETPLAHVSELIALLRGKTFS